MTGFGSAEGPVAGGRLQIEIRSVNHRHFNAQLKLPSTLAELEAQIRELLRSRIHRGHVSVTARWLEEAAREAKVSVNMERARELVAVLEELKGALALPGDIDVGFVARQPDVLTYAASDAAALDGGEVGAVVTAALDQLGVAREREGQALGAEVTRLLTALEGGLEEVEARAPARLTSERDRLRRSVAELLDGRQLDEGRLEQEVALIADKLDITEETVRLRAHLDAARQTLNGAEPVGKRLGFLAQEMLREINTIGSKANDAVIAHTVIGMKGELERLREQLENLE